MSIVSIWENAFGELPEINMNPRKLNISSLVLGTLDSPYHRVAYYIQEYDIQYAHTYRIKVVHPVFIQRCEGCNTAVLGGMRGVRL